MLKPYRPYIGHNPACVWDEASTNRLYKKFYQRKSISLIPKSAEKNLDLVHPDIFKAEILGTDMNWVIGNRKN